MPTRISDFLNTTFSTLSINDAVNNGISYPASIIHTTTGTPGVGIGAGIQFQVETSNNNTELGMTIETVTTDVTAPSEDFDLIVKLMQNGNPAAERLHLSSAGFLTVSSGLTASGAVTGASFAPTSSTIPTNGMFLPVANTVGFAANSIERMRLTVNGNLLVGTTSTNGGAVIIGAYASADTTNYFNGTGLIVQNTNTTANNFGALRYTTANGNDAAAMWTIYGSHTASSATGTLVFGTTNAAAVPTERMRIAADGNIAIGTTTTSNARLTVQGISGANTIGEAYFSDGTQWTRMASNLPSGAYNGIVNANDHAIIYSNGTQLTGGLAIAPWTSATVPTSGLRLDANGNVSIGLTSVTTGYELDVGGSVRVAGGIVATGEITAFFSDARLKANITAITNAVDKVMAINGVYYNANDIAVELAGEDKTVQKVGLLAQEVEAVLPHVVKMSPIDIGPDGNSKTGENYKTLQYERIIPLLVEAIKEQQQQINTLVERVEKLEQSNNSTTE